MKSIAKFIILMTQLKDNSEINWIHKHIDFTLRSHSVSPFIKSIERAQKSEVKAFHYAFNRSTRWYASSLSHTCLISAFVSSRQKYFPSSLVACHQRARVNSSSIIWIDIDIIFIIKKSIDKQYTKLNLFTLALGCFFCSLHNHPTFHLIGFSIYFFSSSSTST